MITAVQPEKRELGLATANADARFLVLAEFALEADKISHGIPRSVIFFLRNYFRMKLTARTTGTPGMGIPESLFLATLALLAVQNHIYFVRSS
jgi:hypothetical protein